MSDPTKLDLAEAGREAVLAFCDINGLLRPTLGGEVPGRRSCGLYDPRTNTIYVTPSHCAALGRGGSCWSWPGHMVDRTPYGVYCHELGHHVDHRLRLLPKIKSREPALTGYCPNRAEWFAEMFRLFVTNPDLLCRVRPLVYDELANTIGLTPPVCQGWQTVLAGAPARTLALLARRVAAGAPLQG